VTSFFFTFFEKFLNGQARPFVYVWLVLVAGFVLDYPFGVSSKDKNYFPEEYRGRAFLCVSIYITTPSSPRFETGGIFTGRPIICVPGRVA